MDDNSTSRIRYELSDVNAFDSEFWPKINKFFIDTTAQLEKAFKHPIEELRNELRQNQK